LGLIWRARSSSASAWFETVGFKQLSRVRAIGFKVVWKNPDRYTKPHQGFFGFIFPRQFDGVFKRPARLSEHPVQNSHQTALCSKSKRMPAKKLAAFSFILLTKLRFRLRLQRFLYLLNEGPSLLGGRSFWIQAQILFKLVLSISRTPNLEQQITLHKVRLS
jgi:hypothetical protein